VIAVWEALTTSQCLHLRDERSRGSFLKQTRLTEPRLADDHHQLRHGHAFIDRALYLPKGWTDDPVRLKVTYVPDNVSFSTKPQLAVEMIERMVAASATSICSVFEGRQNVVRIVQRSNPLAARGGVALVECSRGITVD
jgi:hypothetical protein